MPLEDIPQFLRLSQEERAAAWDRRRVVAKPVPAEPIKRIQSLPGATDDDTDTDT